MHKISKLTPYIFVHLLIGIISCFTFVFFFPMGVNLLPHFLIGWKIREAVLLFIFYLPFLYVSSLILGYTIIFGRYGPVTMQRGSSIMLKFIRSFFIVSIIAVSVYVVLAEAVKPILLEKQSDVLLKTETYNEYTKLAKEAAARKEYENALQHIEKAVNVWPEGGEAKKIYDTIKISNEESSIVNKADMSLENTEELKISENLSPEQALKIAERAMVTHDLYTAHYYAKLAEQTFDNGNPLKTEAEAVAKKSWEEVEKGLAETLEEAGIVLFKDKKAAYEAMQTGNFIKAYYSFLQIKNDLLKRDNTKTDPEVERFLKLSKINLENNTFFKDEIENLPAFTLNKNISFTVGGIEANSKIRICGIARVADKKSYHIYLMNTEYTYSEHGKVKYSILIPYSKLKRIENADGSVSLMLQLRSVDRNIYGNDISPNIIIGELPEKNYYNIILPMSLADFNLIEAASRGPVEMKLSSLYYFSLKAEKYGFIKAAYLREILFRLAEPLLLLIISIAAVIIAWIFRLSSGAKFKKRWIIAVPLCPFFAYLLVETIRYAYKLLVAFFVSVTPKYVSLIIFGMLILLFIGVTARLFYQRSE
ncbi:hypothetical protein [Treponema pedis]|uniref:hypothetical protein n=1 Tax=Treponema pedis TaxID=409322 RepID=UPI0003FCE350|nr:hypothetical protein [Treponema pedis]